MSGGFETTGDVAGYRLTYGSAWHVVDRARRNLQALDPDRPQDVVEVLARTVQDLGPVAHTIRVEIVDQAIDDAMRGRRPRW